MERHDRARLLGFPRDCLREGLIKKHVFVFETEVVLADVVSKESVSDSQGLEPEEIWSAVLEKLVGWLIRNN